MHRVARYHEVMSRLRGTSNLSEDESDRLWLEVTGMVEDIKSVKPQTITDCVAKLLVAYELVDETDKDVGALIETVMNDLTRLSSELER